MFTGIVEHVGRLRALRDEHGVRAVEIEVGTEIASSVAVGASIAIDGCCLTAVGVGPDSLAFEAVPETLQCSALGDRRVGDRVNVERALAATGRFDGHIVQGHVDGCGVVARFDRHGNDVRLSVTCSGDVARYLVPKGSITINGVSLTVVDADADGFDVALIPHTLSVTTLGELVLGARVNLEVDVIGKYVHHFLERQPRPAIP